MELVSIFINLAVVILILLGYRQLDKNNRSLEKVKKYSDRVKENLTKFIDEKSADVRNLSIEIKVNLKTHNEILKRMKEEREKIKQDSEIMTEIRGKFQSYDKILKQLDNSTLVVEENLQRIQNESAFVDKVGKQISYAKDKLDKIEKEIPVIHSSFEKKNSENLQQLKEVVLKNVKDGQAAAVQQIQAVDKQVKDFAAYLSRLEVKKESMFQETVDNLKKVFTGFETNALAAKGRLESSFTDKIQQINQTARLARDKFEKEVQAVETKYYKHLQNISDQGIKMEHEALQGLKTAMAENTNEFNAALEKTYTDLGRQVEVKTAQVLSVLAGTKTQVDKFDADITNEIETIQKTFTEKFSNLKTDINSKIENFILNNREKQKILTQELSGLNQFSEQKIARFKDDFSKSIAEITADLNSFKNMYLDKLNEAGIAGEEQREKLVDTINANLEAARGMFAKNLKELKQDITAVDQLKETINNRIGEIKESFNLNNREITEKLGHFKTEVEKEITAGSTEIETRVLSGLEKRLADYEADTACRIGKIEEITLDINSLEANLARLLESKKDDLSRSFSEYLTTTEQKRRQEEIKTRQIIADLTKEMQEVENSLLELKTKAYENVSAKLKVFEDDFFADLTDRSQAMESNISTWQQTVETTINKMKEKQLTERQQVEERYKKELEEKVAVLKKKTETGIQKVIEFVKTDNNSVREYAKKLSGEVEKVCEEIKARYLKLRENAVLDNKAVDELVRKIKQDLAAWKKTAREEIARMGEDGAAERAKIEKLYNQQLDQQHQSLVARGQQELQSLNADFTDMRQQVLEQFTGFRQEVKTSFDNIRGEVSSYKDGVSVIFTENDQMVEAWRTRIDATVSSYLSTYNQSLTSIKKDLTKELGIIGKDFSKQREDLVLATNGERGKIKLDLKDFAAQLKEFKQTLNQTSKESLEEFHTGYKTMKADFVNTINSFQEDTQSRITGFRQSVQETNTAVQEMQKTNMQQFEAEYKSYREKLKTIDKQLQNFVEQTKLFERADKLRGFLKTAIDELKNDMTKLEPERQKMYAVEGEMNKTKKVAEEVNGKLTRFFAEKRRIDSMEKDFAKLMRIAGDIDVKLENVTSAQDLLQEIQLKLRELDKLENEVELKYTRLEKKEGIIETTSRGIDKNFQTLEELDTGIKTLADDYQTLPPRILNLKQEMKFLLDNKPQTDEILKKIGSLADLLSDIEQRMEKLQTAREWLSRTETRLETIGKEASEQVKLMQSIIKAEAGKKPTKGAPSADKRETVIKLAGQGWSVKEISRATNISQGEVELILELAPAKR